MSSIVPYEQSHSGKPEEEQDKVAIAEVLGQISENPFLRGVVLKEVVLEVGDNIITHGLGRVLQGWWVLRRTGEISTNSETEFDKQNDNPSPQNTLVLEANTVRTVDLYVF